MAGSSNVRLRLAGRADNVLIVRQALTGVADAVGLDGIVLNDISTAVTEACNNVVMHAYGGEEGPLEAEISSCPEGAIEVVVRDRGAGLSCEDRNGGEGQGEEPGGIGLPVIQALAESVDFREVPGGGTEVAMRFDAHGAGLPDNGSAGTEVEPPLGPEAAQEVMTIVVGPRQIARGVLPRVLCALAARAYFTTERIEETQQLADELLAEDGPDASIGLAVGVSPRRLDLRVGRLQGEAQQLSLAQTD